MAQAMTNQERFVASCTTEGETGVRQKLNTGRYSERKAVWAGVWLDEVEGGKSDATKAAEKISGLLKAQHHNRFNPTAWAIFVALLGSVVIAYVVAMWPVTGQ